MRVAAVQLNSTADPAANLAVADRLTRAAAADGASLIVLPEKWTAIGSDEELRAAAETLEGPAIEWARAIARELGVDLIAGSIVERVAGRRSSRTPPCTWIRGARSRRCIARCTCSTWRSAGAHIASPTWRSRARRSSSRDRRRRRAGAVDLLRPALSRALPDPRRARRARDRAAGGVHAGDHARSLGDAS